MVCRNAVSGYNTYGRDCGLQATGAFLHRDGWDMLTYNLALFNGSQMNRTTTSRKTSWRASRSSLSGSCAFQAR